MQDLRFEEYFLYTQYSLTTFEKCPLKFRKRYLESLKWDSFPSEDIKKSIEMGKDFHLMASRYFEGIDTGEKVLKNHILKDWFNNLKNEFKINPSYQYLPEYKLRMTSGTLKLEANFDLLILKGDRIEMWDWKTHGGKSRLNPDKQRKRLENSLQTMVYLYVLGEQSQLLKDSKTDFENISMYYWQPQPPGISAKITYSRNLRDLYHRGLNDRVRGIENYDYNSFNREQYRTHCPFCEFNWFCNNNRIDYERIRQPDDLMEDFDWESIDELD